MVLQLDIGTGKVYNYFWGGLREIAPKKITPPTPLHDSRGVAAYINYIELEISSTGITAEMAPQLLGR